MAITKTEIINSHLERFNNFEAVMDLLCSVIAEVKIILTADDAVGNENQKKLRVLKQSLESILQKNLNNDERILLKGFVMKYTQLCEELINRK